jgi:Peptidase family M28
MSLRRREAAFTTLLAISAGTAGTAQQSPRPAAGIDGISAEGIARHISVLADDSLRGRATPSPGLESAAAYVAAQFRDAGLLPIAGSSLVVRWPLVTTRRVTSAIALESSRAGRSHRFAYGTDFAVMAAGVSRLTGDLIPVADLIDTAAIRGRIPLLRLPAGEWRDPAHAATFAARRAGAKGLVLVLDSMQAVAPVAEAGAAMSHQGNGVPTAMLTPAAARRLLGGRKEAGRIFLSIPERTDTVEVPYVVGMLLGSDPVHRHEYIVLSAHLDHLGVGPPDQQGDSIYNGADDNASGVAGLLEAALAIARLDPRPKRSVIFFATSAEEVCLCGSEHFTRHPPVPLEALVADVNLDGIGRSWQPDTVSAEGSRYSTLGATVRDVGRAHPELRLTIVDDQWPDRNYFTTSDQIWFARRGVPSLFLSSTGPDAHYHRPSDEAITIQAELTARITRLAAWLVVRVADSEERPRWDEEARRSIQIP